MENTKPRKRTIWKLSDESLDLFLTIRLANENYPEVFRPHMGVLDYSSLTMAMMYREGTRHLMKNDTSDHLESTKLEDGLGR